MRIITPLKKKKLSPPQILTPLAKLKCQPVWGAQILNNMTNKIVQSFAASDDFAVSVGKYDIPLEIYDRNNQVAINLPLQNEVNWYLVKWDLSGFPKWAINIVGSDLLYIGAQIYQGNIYIVGSFRNNITLHNVAGLINLECKSDGDEYVTFIAKYNGAGEAQWIRKISSSSEITNLQIHVAQSIIVSGYSGDEIFVYNGNGEISFKGESTFIVEYSLSGEPEWLKWQLLKNARTAINEIGEIIMASAEHLFKYNCFGELQWQEKILEEIVDIAMSGNTFVLAGKTKLQKFVDKTQEWEIPLKVDSLDFNGSQIVILTREQEIKNSDSSFALVNNGTALIKYKLDGFVEWHEWLTGNLTFDMCCFNGVNDIFLGANAVNTTEIDVYNNLNVLSLSLSPMLWNEYFIIKFSQI